MRPRSRVPGTCEEEDETMSEDGFCVVTSTSPGEEHAMHLAGALVERRLAACVQVMPIRSMYRWKGEVARDDEFLLLIKTTSSRYREVESFIRENHPYEVPEVIRLDVTAGLDAYLSWMRETAS